MKTKKIKIFKTTKKLFAATGFVHAKGRFHTEQCLRIVEGFLANVMVFLYLLITADTVKEYMDSIFMTTGK